MVLSIVRLVYSLLFMLGLPIIFCRLLYKGYFLRAYWQRWGERLGFVSFLTKRNSPLHPIWVHAASLGEIIAATPLIRVLQSQYANTPILITTMTVTGSEQVQRAFQSQLNQTVFHSYIPYDIKWVIGRFFNRLEPIALVIMETELWPNLIGIAHRKKIPIVLANARLSPGSVKSYQNLGWFIKSVLNEITYAGAQSHLDVERYTRLGMDKEKIVYTGNLKYDLTLPEGAIEKGAALRKPWDKNRSRMVWIAASTHEGEETQILAAFLSLKKKWPDLLLLLVPRHPGRFEAVYQLCLKASLLVARATDATSVPEMDVFLGDTMGNLWTYYAASDLVFLGGSLVPIGGHNLLEPAALGLPIVTGSHLGNCTEIAQTLQNAQGLTVVSTQAALEGWVHDMLKSPVKAQAQGQAAQKIVQENKGTLERLLKIIKTVLAPKG